MDGMLVCDGCGSLIHPQFVELHQEWHDSVIVVKSLPENRGPVANPYRTRVQDC